MSLTEAEIVVANQALFRIGAKNYTNANEAEKCDTFYEQTRDALQRSFEWNFASTRVALDIVQTLTLDTTPFADPFAADDVVTGLNNGYSATIISATTDTEYEIAYLDGDFEDGESLTNATVYKIYYDGVLVEDEDDDEPVLWCDTTDKDTVTSATITLADSTPDFEWDYKFKLPTNFLRLRSDYTIDETEETEERYTIEGDFLLTNDNEAEVRYIKKVTDPAEFDPLFTEALILALARKLINPLVGTKSSQLVQEVSQELSAVLARAKAVCRTESKMTGKSEWNLAKYGTGKV